MMENKPRFHCFFEQSGTFKNEFKKLGYEAYDYDILNDFGETDYVMDLFHDIEVAYEREREWSSTMCRTEIKSSHSFHVLGFQTKYICTFRET